MKNDINYYAEKLKQEFAVPSEFITGRADDIIGIVCIEHVLCFPLQRMLKEDNDPDKIKKYLSFVEEMYENGTEDIRGVVQYLILEYLLDLYDDEIKRKLYKYLPQKLYEAAKEVEDYIKTRGF